MPTDSSKRGLSAWRPGRIQCHRVFALDTSSGLGKTRLRVYNALSPGPLDRGEQRFDLDREDDMHCPALAAILAAVVLHAAVAVHGQTVLHVPRNYATIQAAIDAAKAKDTVVVAPGRYIESIQIIDKGITVRSSHGPLCTTIDGNLGQQPVVYCSGWASPTSDAIEGFSIVNGGNGGLYCNGSTEIRNNIITGNLSANVAGGVTGDDSVKILGNLIIASIGAKGGGIAWYGSRNMLEVKDNLIADNLSLSYGGGILAEGNGDVFNNVIVRNTALNGGGIGNDGFNATNLNVAGNVVWSNTALNKGGGIACCMTYLALDSNTLAGNTAKSGGGLHIEDATILGRSNILWENTAAIGPEIDLPNGTYGAAKLTLSYSVVRGGQTLVHVGSKSTLVWGPAMASADPRFVDRVAGDLHLRADSPYIDKGDGSQVLIKTDHEGDPRVVGLNVDIGADEFYPHVYTVGRTTPGATFQVKAIGPPASAVVWGFSLNPAPRTPPVNIPGVGLFHLGDPFCVALLGVLPASGSLGFPIALPKAFPAPAAVPMQALIGARLTVLETVILR